MKFFNIHSGSSLLRKATQTIYRRPLYMMFMA